MHLALVRWLVLVPSSILASSSFAQSGPFRARSPGGIASIEVEIEKEGDSAGAPRWRAFFRGKPVVLGSKLGFRLADGTELGGPCDVESVENGSGRVEYDVFPGKRSHVIDQFTEAVISLRERAPPRRRWELVLRAYDDGVAFRYRFPAQENWPGLSIAAERTEVALPGGAIAHFLPLPGFTSSHEAIYRKQPVKEIPAEQLLGLPLLVDCPGCGFVAITEANLTEFAGLYLTRANTAGTDRAILESRLSPLPGEPGIAVKSALPHASPWRVLLLADEAGKLIESDLILHLNEPRAIRDTSWIRPGKTAFPWWNGFHDEPLPFKPGLNTATMIRYVDFCAEAGIPYHSLDGLDNVGWYGCQIGPHRPADPTRAVPAIDLPELLRHAAKKGVRLRLWLHWRDVAAHMRRAFPIYREWGIEGVMLDFMDRDDQEMTRFLREMLVLAAENRLTVTLHGMSKPTGLERTFPNLLSSEGVLNLEYNKWDPIGCPPDHQVTVAYTRMLAGPLDFHQGSFRGVPVADFKPRVASPLVMGTATRTLASYVVYQNHLPMVADDPASYRGHPGLSMLARIPCTWDDTRFLAGKVGEHVTLARRSGKDWYVGAMNGLEAREIEVPLRFLGPGKLRAEVFADEAPGKSRLGLEQRLEEVTAEALLKIRLAPAGGYMARISPLPE